MRTWVIVALAAAGCAGQLQPEPAQKCPPDCPPTWTGPTTTGSATTGSTTTGAGGGPGTVDMCIVNTSAIKACQAAGCHTWVRGQVGDPDFISAGLDLSVASVTTNARLFLDKPNVGTMGVTTRATPRDARRAPSSSSTRPSLRTAFSS